MTCSRETLGKPSRKTSIESPASRWSISVWIGTRVPAKQGAPLMISGSILTTDVISLYLGCSRSARPLPARLYRPCRSPQSLHSIESRPHSFHAVEGFLEQLQIRCAAGLFSGGFDPFLLESILRRAVVLIENTEHSRKWQLRKLVGRKFIGHVVS